MKIVIRAGGTGTRLWPMSRISNPKQFQKVIGEESMIKTTYKRVLPALKRRDDLFVSVNKDFVKKTLRELPGLKKDNLIIETDTRNTGPAMCLEACFLERRCQKEDIVASLPSDDYISDGVAFRRLLSVSEEFLKENPEYILTPAIRPDYPDTGYSYFKAGNKLSENGEETIYTVANVVEKPNQDYCQEIIDSGVYYCHTGMYIWQLKNIISLFRKKRPKMYKICQTVAALIAEKNDLTAAQELYGKLEKMTIESAITQKCDHIAMSVSNKIGWSDLGKWHIIKRIVGNGGNLTKGEVISIDSENNLVYSTNKKKIVAVNDVKNLVIVDTKDALFISSLENSHEAKKVVEHLKAKNKNEYL
ncbi:MAG: sugar phosphate nucleotidyltransferase [Candidatus Falkowbacteria bacterium]